MIPVGTSVNPGELRSGPKWEKTFISYPQPPTLSLESTVVKLKPYEPLLVRSKDGEVSIPRRIFYDICKVYRPYTREVIATLSRLLATFALIFVVFSLIVKFQIFEEFSGQWETILMTGTVALPSLLRMLRSSHYRDLSDRRRESKIRAWLQKITTTRKVRVDLNKSVKIAIGKFLFKVAEKKA